MSRYSLTYAIRLAVAAAAACLGSYGMFYLISCFVSTPRWPFFATPSWSIVVGIVAGLASCPPGKKD
jgi:hypothetical protein